MPSPPPPNSPQKDTDCQSASTVAVLLDSLLSRLRDLFPEVTEFSLQSVRAGAGARCSSKATIALENGAHPPTHPTCFPAVCAGQRGLLRQPNAPVHSAHNRCSVRVPCELLHSHGAQ
jgi:hypothetical protein